MEARPPRSPVLLFLTAKPGNEAAAPPRPHPHHTSKSAYMTKKFLNVIFSEFTYAIQPITDTKQFMNLGELQFTSTRISGGILVAKVDDCVSLWYHLFTYLPKWSVFACWWHICCFGSGLSIGLWISARGWLSGWVGGWGGS